MEARLRRRRRWLELVGDVFAFHAPHLQFVVVEKFVLLRTELGLLGLGCAEEPTEHAPHHSRTLSLIRGLVLVHALALGCIRLAPCHTICARAPLRDGRIRRRHGRLRLPAYSCAPRVPWWRGVRVSVRLPSTLMHLHVLLLLLLLHFRLGVADDLVERAENTTEHLAGCSADVAANAREKTTRASLEAIFHGNRCHHRRRRAVRRR
mmetsp:Transcript_15382/g.63883  ORF Transcript_15382/g.63883 Transcript_15382/m.63883 type:complete len:207 (+) Transcript_15382:632-1252(+)